MEQSPQNGYEPKNKENATSNRRGFLKKVSYLGAALAGTGKTPMDIVKSEMRDNKKREGNAVTVTLKDGKKISLVLGIHDDQFSKGQVVPESEILAVEWMGSFDDLFKERKDLVEAAAYPILDQNNTPVMREMMQSGKSLYQCDIQKKDSFLYGKSLLNAETTAGYFVLAFLSSATVALLSKSKSSARRKFLSTILKSLSVGLSTRVIARVATDGEFIPSWNKPEKVTPAIQLGEKYQQLDNNSQLGLLLGGFGKNERLELKQVAVLVRSIIMALKLKSALRMSNKQSITMTLGATHILVEDFVTMNDEDLFKKLTPFGDGLKKYFNIETIYKMTYAFYDKTGKINIVEKEDPVLKKLVEEYLK